ncbi:Fructosamine kinase domain containing protein [Naviculisporaceae sp. PSN 640]
MTVGLQFGDDPQVDPNVLSVLPDVSRVINVQYHGESAWAKAIRIDVEQCDGSEKSYFMKVSVGHHGREALKGEFEGTSAIYAAVPGFSPRPLAWGTLSSQPDSHFYVCDFYEFVDGALPEPTSFCKNLARLHQAPQKSPNQKFGFHCTTYNGDLPQDNTWFDKWEDFFANSLRHVLKVREERAGPNDELDSLLPTLFEKVIPRLLRPLETGGRTLTPSLVHGDLWCGNAAVIEETDESIVYDPAAFWGHNECKRFQTTCLPYETTDE